LEFQELFVFFVLNHDGPTRHNSESNKTVDFRPVQGPDIFYFILWSRGKEPDQLTTDATDEGRTSRQDSKPALSKEKEVIFGPWG
jgi:hypothetical protein